ncbi:peptidase U32 family protein [Guggenheimella bovis]
MIKILAPAGKKEQLIAAVQAGADEVYLGGRLFSARAFAGNFEDEELQESIDYCHKYGVKVNVAINTLLKDSELEEAVQYVKKFYELGVDAFIVTDPGLIHRLLEIEGITLHASTQATIHDSVSASFYKLLGFERVIPSRELSYGELEEMVKTGVEVEAFIQGALCICYSGQCLMSSGFGPRSANRGRCAQPCRLEYKLGCKVGTLLSPKDLSVKEGIRKLDEIGIVSAKIEGRMRSPEYVYEAVRYYRDLLDGKDADPSMLQLAFSRGEFTNNYLEGIHDHTLMSETQKKTGIPIGTVKGGFLVLDKPLTRLDGIAYRDDGSTVERLERNGREIERAERGDRVKVYPNRLKEGDVVYKNASIEQKRRIDEMLKNPFERAIEVEVKVEVLKGKPIRIQSEEEFLEGPVAEEAKRAPLSEEQIKEKLEKRSETPFQLIVKEVTTDHAFVPVKVLNDLRRSFVEKLEEKTKVRRTANVMSKIDEPKKLPKEHVIVVVSTKKQLEAAKKFPYPIAIDPSFQDPDSLSFEDIKEENYLYSGGIIRREMKDYLGAIERGVRGVVSSNLSLLLQAKGEKIASEKFQMMNSEGKKLYPFLDGSVLSEELRREELERIEGKEQHYIKLFGRVEGMITEHCVHQTGTPCERPCRRGVENLIDRMGKTIYVKHSRYCRNHLYHEETINLIAERNTLEKMGYKNFLLHFTTESYDEVLETLRKINEPQLQTFTSPFYLEGVE